MELLLLKKITLLFILLSASLLSASCAGGKWRFMDESAANMGATTSGVSEEAVNSVKVTRVGERILKVHTKDYDSYDPSPTFVKPPFKLIPN